MENKSTQPPPRAGTPRFVRDRELAPLINVSVGFLQKDRIGAQIIPFVRIGDLCLYDIEEAIAAVKARTVGGTRGRRRFGFKGTK